MSISLFLVFYVFFAILAWRRLNWAVLLTIAALPSYLIRFDIGWLPMTLLEGMVIIIFAAWLFRSNSKFKTLVIGHWSLVIPIGLFLLAATIGIFVAPDIRAAAGIWKAYFIEPVLFFIVLYDLKIKKNQIITALSITTLLLSAYAIYQRFTGFGIPPPWNTELRVTSIFPYPNALGLFLGPLVPIFIAMAIDAAIKRFGKMRNIAKLDDRQVLRQSGYLSFIHFIYWLVVSVLSITAIIFAESTGALVGIAAGIVFMGAIRVTHTQVHDRELVREAKFYILHFTFYILVILGLVGLLFAFPKIKNELLLRDWSGHVRRTQWTETITMLKDRPIFGAGLAGYKETLAPYHKATYLEIFEYPHNIALNFWSETGLLGLATFIWLIFIFFQHAFKSLEIRNWKLEIPAMASMAAMLVHGLVDVPYFKNDLAILFWIVYAMGLSNNHLSYERTSK